MNKWIRIAEILLGITFLGAGLNGYVVLFEFNALHRPIQLPWSS